MTIMDLRFAADTLSISILSTVTVLVWFVSAEPAIRIFDAYSSPCRIGDYVQQTAFQTFLASRRLGRSLLAESYSQI
jgi:hypothetical protein